MPTIETFAPATCTVGPSAVSGARCGEVAVISFVGSDDVTYHECAEHAVAIAPLGRNVGDSVPVDRYGRTYTGTIVRVGKRGAVYAEIRYANGATRVVRV